MTAPLAALVAALERLAAAPGPERLRERLDALDRLDALASTLDPARSGGRALLAQANALRARVESINERLYAAIRDEIRAHATSSLMSHCLPDFTATPSPAGEGYDYLDDLVAGVLQLHAPDAADAPRRNEMVFYQPTPARHIFDLLARSAPTADDVLVDLGSGLGHVPLLTAMRTPAHAIGIEIEAAYVRSARAAVIDLHLPRVEIVDSDARDADLSAGTVFYLYTPFVGSIFADVVERLRREAQRRRIRIATFGPCAERLAGQSWLHASAPLRRDRIGILDSQS